MSNSEKRIILGDLPEKLYAIVVAEYQNTYFI